MSHTDSQPSVVMYRHRLRQEELQRAAEQRRRRRELRRDRPKKRARSLWVRHFLGRLRNALHKRRVTAPRRP